MFPPPIPLQLRDTRSSFRKESRSRPLEGMARVGRKVWNFHVTLQFQFDTNCFAKTLEPEFDQNEPFMITTVHHVCD